MNKRVIAALLSAFMVLNSVPAMQVSAADAEPKAEAAKVAEISTGPLYWMAYESPFEQDKYLEEDRWDQNVEWMASEGFVDAGYQMMSTDGWIEGAQVIDENGYITKYNYSWEKTWKEMADQLREKGMTLGVYYDPLWVTAAAYHSDAKIVGTEIPVKSLVNEEFGHFSDFKPQALPQGEGFDGQEWCKEGEPALYWLDTDQEGAEAYVKGYVKHFADAGATFLRVDFLGWYENGINGDAQQNGKPAYGTERYETALRWMREACDENGVMLSLVMPNQYNHAEIELKYGHMMRVNEDVGNGGWDNPSKGPEPNWQNNHISGRRRGQWQADWAQWGNSFDAFTGWADVGGRGQMILDGDFLRMARFDVVREDDQTERPIAGDEWITADAQKRSAVSLAAMAGSPICIADQYDTLNKNAPEGVDNSSYYLNQEILALNKAGFVGKPMGLGESERWAGQLPDGSWVVGLFNRDRSVKTQTLNFQEDLGITGTASVRELWQHKNYGKMDRFTVDLSACDCTILKITPDAVRYEAEVASLRGGANYNKNHCNFSGWGFADKLEKSGGDVLFAVNASGTQDIQIRYCNGSAENVPVAGVYVNGQKVRDVELPSTGNWDGWGTVTVEGVEFAPGENLVDIKCESEAGFNMDYIEVGTAGAEPEKKAHILCEAEGAQIGSGAKIATDHELAYDKRFVDGLDGQHWAGSNDTLKFTFAVEDEGDYDLNFRYANGREEATADVIVNDQKLGYFTFPVVYPDAWDAWGVVTLFEAQQGGEGIQMEKVHLNAGTNTVEYKHGNGAVNMDCLIITPHKEDTIRTVESVQSFEGIRVTAGTPFEEINLPSKATVTLAGEETPREVTVTWTEEDIRLDAAGTYLLTGILQLGELGENISNTKAAEIAVTVEGTKITEVEKFTGIEIEKGVAFADLALPQTANVTLEDGTEDTLDITWEQGNYNNQKAGTYALTGALELKKGMVNPDGRQAQIDVTVKRGANEPEEIKILGVEKFAGIKAAKGTAFTSLALPNTAVVTLEDETTDTLEISWNQGNYNAQKAGVYTISGDLQQKEGIINPNGVKAQILVTLEEDAPNPPSDRKISNVSDLAGIRVAKGTAFESLPLPKTVEVTLSDGAKETLSITWSEGAYDAQKAGTYTISGDLQLKEGIVNPDGRKAQITVAVTDGGEEPDPSQDKKITAVKELAAVEAAKGTAFERLALPKTAEVTLEDGAVETLNITWNAGNYNAQTVGTYTLRGDLQLKEGIVNPDGILAQIVVTVKEASPVQPSEKKIAKVRSLTGLSVVLGTPFEKLSLPKTVTADLEDKTVETLEVTWSKGGYNAQKTGNYTLSGELKLKQGVVNPLGLKAQIVVTVKEDSEVRVGKVFTSGDYRYKVTSTSKKTVSAIGSKKKTIKKIAVPDTVKLNGKRYQVTEVGASAFKNCKKAASVKVGKNVLIIGKNAFYGCQKVKQASLDSKKLKSIGSKAFYNCKALGKVTVKSTALKKVGSNAFAKTAKKLTIYVPAKKKAAYKKLLKNKGLSKAAKIK